MVLAICYCRTCYDTRIRAHATALVAVSDPVPCPHRNTSTAGLYSREFQGTEREFTVCVCVIRLRLRLPPLLARSTGLVPDAHNKHERTS
eukprot:2414081-Prymnesium_polylepis.1